jgi:hypothetical protein
LLFKQPAVFPVKGSTHSALPAPQGIAIADLIGATGADPDGWPEIAVCNYGDHSISVFRNMGSGSWTGDPPTGGLSRIGNPISLNPSPPDPGLRLPYGIVAADMNGRNGTDLVISCLVANFLTGELDGEVIVLLDFGDDAHGTLMRVRFPALTVGGVGVGYFSGNPDLVRDVVVASSIISGGLEREQIVIVTGPFSGWIPDPTPTFLDVLVAGIDFAQTAPPVPGYATDIAVSPAACAAPEFMVSAVRNTLVPAERFAYRFVGSTNQWSMIQELGSSGPSYGVASGLLDTNSTADYLIARFMASGEGGDSVRPYFPQPADGCGAAALARDAFTELTAPAGAALGKVDLNNFVDAAVACTDGPGGTQWADGGVLVFQHNSVPWPSFY